MTHAEVLRELLELGGVKGAAFVTAEGEILESRMGDARDLARLEALTGYLASSRAFAELLGAPATQTVLEFTSGAALLTLLTDAPAPNTPAPNTPVPNTPVSVVVLSTADAAGRVRFFLRRLLPKLTDPLTGPAASPAPTGLE